MKTLILVSLISISLLASEYTEFIAKIPNGTYRGVVKSSLISSSEMIECSVKIEATWFNRPELKSMVMTVGNKKSRNMSLNYESYEYRHIIVNETSNITSYNAEFRWAECCHSGGRYYGYVKSQQNSSGHIMVTSFKLTQFEDIGPNYEEVLTFDGDCRLNHPILLK